MIDILMIADDMTGMLDTEVQFANKGIPADAFLREITVEDLQKSEASIVAVTTESRHLTKEEAYQKVFEITNKAKLAGVKIIFKKTDSVLRGHLGAEFQAVMDAAEKKQMLFFPAYPEMGRSTKNGIQYVNGIPVHENGAKHDRLEAVRSSYIPDLLKEETDIPVEVISSNKKWTKTDDEKRIYVFDAENENEMYEQIQHIRKDNKIEIVAGCAGLAKELAKIIQNEKKEWRANFPAKHLFAVCGSQNSVTKNQVRYAIENGFSGFYIPVDDLFDPEMTGVFHKEELRKEIMQACREKKSIVLAPVRKKEDSTENTADMSRSKDIVDRLNDILLECMDELEEYTFFHTGGDTLSSFINLGGCKKIVVCGEISPGVAINRFVFDKYEKYVISKSGGFGEKEILVQCLEHK